MKNLSIEELKDVVASAKTSLEQYLALELIAICELKGDQVPVYQIEDADGWHDCEKEEYLSLIKSQSIPDMCYRVLFTAPQKPVVPVGFLFVVKANGQIIYSTAGTDVDGAQLVGPIYGDLAIEAADGIVKESK